MISIFILGLEIIFDFILTAKCPIKVGSYVQEEQKYRHLICYVCNAMQHYSVTNNLFPLRSVNVSLSTLARLVSRWATPVGSCTVWNTVSSPMARCPATNQWVAMMTRSPPSSVILELANTYHVPSLQTLNQRSLVNIVMVLHLRQQAIKGHVFVILPCLA